MEKDPSRAEKQSENQSTGWESLENMEFQGDIIKEARAYDSRMDALQEAIRNSDANDEEKKSQLRDLNDTKRIVMRHVRYENVRPPDFYYEAEAFKRFNAKRIMAHDEMIKQLNYLNKTAEENGTPRFTEKNYTTMSAFKENPEATKADERKMFDDRREVVSYFDEVFSDEIAEEEELIRMNDYKMPGYNIY